MKKLILALSTLLLGGGWASAETLHTLLFGPDYNQSKVNGYLSDFDVICDGFTWSIHQFNNFNNGWDYIRCGAKADATKPSITTSFLESGKVNEIIIYGNLSAANTGKVQSAAVNIYNAVPTGESTPIATVSIPVEKFEGSKNKEFEVSVVIPEPAANLAYEIVWDIPKLTANGLLNITKVEYNGTMGEAPSVLSPVVNMEKTSEGYFVSMTCETEGAKIYYTSGSESPADPDSNSNEYTAPVKVTGLTYFKAVAYLDDTASSVVSFTANPPLTIDNFASLSDRTGDVDVEMTGSVYGIYQNNDYLYVGDAEKNGMLIYGSGAPDVKNGDVIAGLSGTYTLFNGQPKIKNFTLGEITAGATVEPTVITLSDIDASILNKYVKLNGMTIENVSGAKYTIKDAEGNSAVMYNKFTNANKYTVVDVPEGENFTIIGFIGKNYDDLQVIPVSFENGIVMEQVATPVIEPGSGELVADTEITITCATEDAVIYYTLDGATPTVDSTEYTGAITFTEAMTLKAIAVKEGMLDSEVAEATYTLYDENQPEIKVYTFDFTDPSIYDIEAPAAGAGTNLCEKGGSVSFTEGEISLIFECAENASTQPRLWGKNSNGTTVYDVRVYAGSTVTFVSNKPENDRIQKIEFVQNTGATDWASGNTYVPDTFDTATKTWNAEADAEPEDEFVMTPSAKTFFSKAKVTVVTSLGVTKISEDENAEPVYYNLQGVRVSKPSEGLYIVVKGNKSSKVMF